MCRLCSENARSQTKEEIILTPPPDYPFQHVVSDLFQSTGFEYIAYADRLTGWIELAHHKTPRKSSDIMATYREFFHRFGVPEELAMDGGPNISSTEITAFLRWRQSSAYYPKSNGRVEAAVKTMKRVICGNTGRQGSININIGPVV